MKKTLIALAVAASAAVSGSAMAWTVNGDGGSVSLSGAVNVLAADTPWEVQTGDAVSGLDATIHTGDRKVEIPAKNTIPVLAIRTKTDTPFKGQNGISPQIDFNGAIDINSFNQGKTNLTLEVKDTSDKKIGTLTTILSTGAEASVSNGTISSKYNVFAANPGNAFYGGVGKSNDKIYDKGWFLANLISTDNVKNYKDQSGSYKPEGSIVNFENPLFTYSAFYAAGILNNAVISIVLDDPAKSNITWKASLPVSVTYQ